MLVSKGLVEIASGRREFGMDRVRQVLRDQAFTSAQDVCHDLLERAVKHSEQPSSFGPQFSIAGFRHNEPNDLTVVCLMRMAQAAAVA